MWKCHKCGKPVYFAERKQSLGYDWHPECLRCEECGKRLNPGQHAEHKGIPYCHVPCYGALFGPQLFGHGTRVESHKSFGQHQRDSPKLGGPTLPRSQLEAKLKAYNQFYDGKSGEVRSREVNGRLILEGSLRIHWGVQGVIHLKENDDQRTVVTVRKRNSYRQSSSPDFDSDEDSSRVLPRDESCSDVSTASDVTMQSVSDCTVDSPSSGTPILDASPKSLTLPSKLDVKKFEWDELDELLQVERKVDETEKMYQTMPVPLPSQSSLDSISNLSPDKSESISASQDTTLTNGIHHNEAVNTSESSIKTSPAEEITRQPVKDDSWIEGANQLNRSMSGPDCLLRHRATQSPEFDTASVTSNDFSTASEIPQTRTPRTGSTAIRRRTGKRYSRSKLKRRCSINGHFYDRETSFFTPPHGSQMSVWVTSLVTTQEVINLMLEKYKVDSDPNNFALFVVRDNGEQKRLKDDEYPLVVRVLLGPHEDVVRLFLMDSHNTPEVSCEVAQFLNLTLAECRAILNQYYAQEEREANRVREKFQEMKMRMRQRMDELKVRL